jgi:hypothetical protein
MQSIRPFQVNGEITAPQESCGLLVVQIGRRSGKPSNESRFIDAALCHLTGEPTADWIIFSVGVLFCLYGLKALRLAREGTRLFLSHILKAVVISFFLVVASSVIRPQVHLSSTQEQMIAGFGALICFVRFRSRKRSRTIPKATRRAGIAQDLKGENFDPRRHHIDHDGQAIHIAA